MTSGGRWQRRIVGYAEYSAARRRILRRAPWFRKTRSRWSAVMASGAWPTGALAHDGSREGVQGNLVACWKGLGGPVPLQGMRSVTFPKRGVHGASFLGTPLAPIPPWPGASYVMTSAGCYSRKSFRGVRPGVIRGPSVMCVSAISPRTDGREEGSAWPPRRPPLPHDISFILAETDTI